MIDKVPNPLTVESEAGNLSVCLVMTVVMEMLVMLVIMVMMVMMVMMVIMCW